MIKQSMLDEFVELVSLPVHSKDERLIADVLSRKLRDLGFTVEEDTEALKLGGNTGNIIAKLKGEEGIPAILFSAHMDRVENPGTITPVIDREAGVIRSDGSTILAADDVGGIVAILDGIRRVKESGKPFGDIEVVFCVCEEIGVLGSRYVPFGELSAKSGFVLDTGGSVGKMVIQAPAKCKLTITVKGLKAHAGIEPEKGINAIKVAAVALARLPEGRLSPTSTANFGIVKGGSSTNVVCDECVLVGEARSTNAEELENYLELVRTTFAEAAKEYRTEADVHIEKQYGTFTIDENSETVTMARSAMARQGIEAYTVKSGGGSDANHFNEHGIPTLNMGVGYSKNHTNAEQITIEDLEKAGILVGDLILEMYERNAK
jgi:tripeptide aminopeptidase